MLKLNSLLTWALASIICGVIHMISVVIINRNLPQWTNYNTQHELGFVLTWSATIIGLYGVFALIILIIRNITTSNSTPLKTLTAASIVSLISIIILAINAHFWFGIY